MQTLRGFLLSAVMLLLGMTFIGEASAQHRPRPTPTPIYPPVVDPYQPSYPDYDRGRGRDRIVLEERLNQDFFGPQILQLRKILRLGREYAGYDLQRIIVTGSSALGRAQATLLLDGRADGLSQTLGMYESRLDFAVRETLGEDVRRVELELRGHRMHIQSVAAVLVLKRNRTQLISEYVGQMYMAGQALLVGQTLRLQQYAGSDLKFVELDARALGRRGPGPRFDDDFGPGRGLGRGHGRGLGHGRQRFAQAVLMVNGVRQGLPQMISELGGRVRFDLRGLNTLGRDIRSVQIHFTDDVQVLQVSAGIEQDRRGGHHGGGRHDGGFDDGFEGGFIGGGFHR